MLFSKIACAAALTAIVYANPEPSPASGNSDGTGTSLEPNAVQSGSFFDGRVAIGANEAQQAKSSTSQNNFINFCAGKTLTNGLQILAGSCNGIVMGDMPSKENMVSSIITFPTTGGTIKSDTDFNITVQMSNIVAGQFTNADATYYAAPQFLQGGIIVGHTHVTVQNLGKNMNPSTAPDPTQFAFFKGINDDGNGKGLLSAAVTGGLPAGNYRVCTMAAAANHQPVLMPVAQRGSPDDCTKFTVSGDGTTINAAANDGSGGIAAAALASSAAAAGPGFSSPLASSASSTSSTAATATKSTGNDKVTTTSASKASTKTGAGKTTGNKNGAKGGKNSKQRRSREFIA